MRADGGLDGGLDEARRGARRGQMGPDEVVDGRIIYF
jgi:hypothetical protein